MTREERTEFLKALKAHAETVGLAEACATTTRDLTIGHAMPNGIYDAPFGGR